MNICTTHNLTWWFFAAKNNDCHAFCAAKRNDHNDKIISSGGVANNANVALQMKHYDTIFGR